MAELALQLSLVNSANCDTALRSGRAVIGSSMSKSKSELPTISFQRAGPDSELIYIELKQLLMIGEFTPGQKLPLPMLAAAFGTSQMPIREATNRLISVRALESPPRRSLCVPEATIERIDTLLPLRLLLEGEATRLATPNATSRLTDELAAITEEMGSKVPNDDFKAYLRLNQQFHFSIYQSCGNSELIDLIELLWMRYGPMLNIVRNGALSKAGQQHHLEIIRALRDRDAKIAAASMQADIRDAAIPVRSALEGK
ncbi:GntR family transcriptional regulator [Rhizobium metallidurans]|uniref:DNA-binding GntR family transcriptional regulator n=1 Tax=Rhizobium metallidurans TaxID=1265931 RepID=A0A7W6GF27_9HYPH|nr:GntR family transcriptional regulator [Rhizobium metallidurans]MBB3967301.1 DNA-binding GntR family transcriptional regulator [Rhizobium metallidurans]